MKVLEKDKVVYFDCDETLVIWNYPPEAVHCIMEFDNYGFKEYLVPNYRMMDTLKKNYSQGNHVIVWSQNGYKWAKEVVTKLGLTKYVHLVQSKPEILFDDLPPQDFIKRAYLPPNYNDERYKKNKLKEEGN